MVWYVPTYLETSIYPYVETLNHRIINLSIKQVENNPFSRKRKYKLRDQTYVYYKKLFAHMAHLFFYEGNNIYMKE